MVEELAKLPPADMETRVAETQGVALVQFDPPVAMRPKRFVDRSHAARIWSERSDAEHRVDGLILHRADAPYVHGTATGAVWGGSDHSVDLMGPPGKLHAADGALGASVLGRSVEVVPSRVECHEDAEVAEYHLDVDATTVRVFAMRKRPDKKTANGLAVIAATVQDAVDAVQPEELCGGGERGSM